MSIVVTEKAIKEVIHIAEEQNLQLDEIVLRVRVIGGGCSGFQTKLDLDQAWNEKTDDIVEVGSGVKLCVDKRSALYLNGAEIDFSDEELGRRGFIVNNPLAKNTCGCGSSFSM